MASSPEPSPPKPGTALSAKLQNASKEELEKMLLDSFKKLKQRDQKLAKLQQAHDILQEQSAGGKASSSDPSSDQRAAEAEAECKSLRAYLETADARLQDSLEENSVLQEQLHTLKQALRSLAASKDELTAAQAQLQQAAEAAEQQKQELAKLQAASIEQQGQQALTQGLLDESRERLHEALEQLEGHQAASKSSAEDLDGLRTSLSAGKQELQQACKALSEQRQQTSSMGKRLRQQMSQVSHEFRL